MITVFHKGDAPEILATLTELGIAFTEWHIARVPPEASWAAGMFLREIGRTRDLGGGSHEVLTPTTTIDNGYGRSIIAGDHPDTVLAKLPPIVPAARGDRPAPVVYPEPLGPGNEWDRLSTPVCPCWNEAGCQTPDACAVTEADYADEPRHERQPDGTCSCKTGLGAEVAKAALAPVCPECRQGKHRVCVELALDEATDEIVPCACPPAFGHAPRNIAQGAEHTGRGHA